MKQRHKKITALLLILSMLLSLIPPAGRTASAAENETVSPLVFYDFQEGMPEGLTAATNGTGKIPSLTWDSERGKVLDLDFGGAGAENYVAFPNPYSGRTNLSGATMMLWVKVDPSSTFLAYDNLIGFQGDGARLTLQTMPYLCWNNGTTDWVDLKSSKDPALTPGIWAHVAVTIADNKAAMYINGVPITYIYNGDGTKNTASNYNTEGMLSLLADSKAYLGCGSFWGTQDCFMDSVAFYDTALTPEQVNAAYLADPNGIPGDTVTGLKAHYSFDNTLTDSVSQSTASEIYGSGENFGKPVTESSLEYVVGQSGNALFFSGGNSSGLSLPTTITSRDYTISFWMNPWQYNDWSSLLFATEDKGGFLNIMGQGWNDGSNHPQIRYWRDSDGQNYVTGNTEEKAPVGQWTQVTYVVKQEESQGAASLQLYVNGELKKVFVYPDVAAAGQALPDFFSGGISHMYLGINYWDSAFYGAIDEVYLYERALSSKDCAALYGKGMDASGDSGTALPKTRVSVHDPSVIKANNTYYIFGSHLAWAKSTDLENWTYFTNNINTDYSSMFGSLWESYCKTETNQNLSGNMWAPDVIYNTAMNKYCMYLSINGDDWNSAIVLLTSDSIEGPYTYIGPVVYSGFNTTTHPAEKTDVYTVLGTGADLARYQSVENTKINAIDPSVCYDKNGDLWMTFGSWFGGIYMLKLDGATGLRDYQTSYTTVPDVSDAYYGHKIAGGHAVSGEGPYILYNPDSDYYYLFVSYAGFAAAGGYNMRLYRSKDITGPYTDAAGYSSVRSSSGDNSPYGIKIMGNYTFDCLAKGYKSPGHNSAFMDTDGQMYLIYHTRFDDGTETHQVRVHQMFLSEDGWLVTAPYEYSKDTQPEAGYTLSQAAGSYEFINHGSSNLAAMLPTLKINLNSDGNVTGDITGTWNFTEGTNKLTLTYGGVTYKGVFFYQSDESSSGKKVMTFSAIGTNNQSIWGSKLEFSDYQLIKKDGEALQALIPNTLLSDIALPVKGSFGSDITWTSSNPEVLSSSGKINRQFADTEVLLMAKLTKGSEVMLCQYTVVVKGSEVGSLDISPIYRYEFQYANNGAVVNQGARSGDALLMGSASIVKDSTRGNVLELYNEDKAIKVNYLALPSDTFNGMTSQGFTVGMWVNVDTSGSYWEHSALFEANGGGQDKFPLTRLSANLFGRINSSGAWSDATSISTPLTGSTWQYVSYTADITGVKVYLNGKLVGSDADDLTKCFANNVLNLMTDVRLGSGNIWGDEDISHAKFDNLVLYDRALTANEMNILYNLEVLDSSVDSVDITPSAASVAKGKSLPFTAAVSGINVKNQNVIWSVSGSAISTISAAGLLTVPAEETAEYLTVKAVSVEDAAISGQAPVTVITPTDTPSPEPTEEPTTAPTDTPTNVPTDTPTNAPTDTPTNAPTDTPTNTPTDTPTNVPTDTPTNVPTDTPTGTPTDTPTDIPTDTPSPSAEPTAAPTPTPAPTESPTPAVTPAVTEPTATPAPAVTDSIPGNTLSPSVSLTATVENGNINARLSLDTKEAFTKLAETAKDTFLTIPLSSEKLTAQLSTASVKNLDITLQLDTSLLRAEKRDNIRLDLSAALLKASAASGTDITLSVENETGHAEFTWSFDSQAIKEDKNSLKNGINLFLSTLNISGSPAASGLLSQGNRLSDGMVIHFNHEGSLPADTSVRIYAGDILSASGQSGSQLYVYYHNKTTGKLEELPNSTGSILDPDGYFTISLRHCSDYVVLTKAPEKQLITSLADQVTVKVSAKTLYVGGTKDNTAKITLGLPSTLTLVSTFGKSNSSSSTGEITAAYKSSNTKVAKVSSSGQITATGTGTVSITTTLHLGSKETKKIITKITVRKPYIKIQSSISSMKIGETAAFTAKAYGMDAKNIIWTTSKKSVVAISKKGKAAAKSKGTDYVIAKVDGIVDKIKITVK